MNETSTHAFYSRIHNAKDVRRFVHHVSRAMALDEGDYLTLATVTAGKNRKETTIGRLDRADEAAIVVFLHREITRHGEGRFKIRYVGAQGRPSGSKTFTHSPNGLRKPSATPATEESPARQPARSVVKRQDTEISSLRSAIDDERRRCGELGDALREAEQKGQQLEGALRRTNDSLEKREIEVNELLAKIEELRKQRDERAASEKKLWDQLRRDKDQIYRLKQEGISLRAQLREEQESRSRAERSEPTGPNREMTTELEELHRKLANVTQQRDDARRKANHNRRSTAAGDSVRDELRAAENERVRWRDHATSLEQKVEELQRELRKRDKVEKRAAQYIKELRADRDTGYEVYNHFLNEGEGDDD